MKYAMLIDSTRCSICYSCQVACKDEFVGEAYPPYSYSQTDTEPSWIRVSEDERGEYPRVKVYPTPVLCMQCENAPCIKACPVEGCMYKLDNGTVIIDSDKCTGCQACKKACPYDAIVFNNDKGICQKCTFCQHRIAEGKEPACVDACPSGVLFFGEESKIIAEAKKRGAKTMSPEYKTKPSVYYVGLPSPSIAGHLIDSKTLMDVTGAEISVVGADSAKTKVKSTVSGMFLIQELKADKKYSIEIVSKGYKPKTINNISLDIEYKHLGNIKLDKA